MIWSTKYEKNGSFLYSKKVSPTKLPLLKLIYLTTKYNSSKTAKYILLHFRQKDFMKIDFGKTERSQKLSKENVFFLHRGNAFLYRDREKGRP